MKQRLLIKNSVAMILTLVILISVVGSAMARQEKPSPGVDVQPAPSQVPGPTDPAELEAFMDDFFAGAMEEYHIAGAAVAVVKDGKLFFTKGYGYADVAKGIPVDPEETVFRIGSNTKPFTWTAVMQLVEQRKLDLDADVNTYLDFRIPDTYPQPITLKHLMTHSSGFGERWLESLVMDEAELLSEREWLVSNMPKRQYPPGGSVGYSNYNAILAGYIVARVSEQSYPQYIQEHILNTLGMSHSIAGLPITPELRANLSVGYEYVDGGLQPYPDYTGQPAGYPSGAIRATVTDMARWMIAHLEYGRYSGDGISEARILQESTARQMQATLFTPDPRLRGTAYAFADFTDNGVWTLGHQGYYPPMNSQLLLLPDQDLGIFIAFNTKNVGDLTTQHVGFQRAFFDRYFPAPSAEHIEPPADFAERSGRFVGLYRVASYPAATPDKVAQLLGGFLLEVSAPGDGTLVLPINGIELRFVEVEPLYFRQADGPFSLIFTEDDQGRITQLYTDFQPQYAALKLPWYETNTFNMSLLVVSLLLLLSVLPVALVQAVINRRRGGEQRPAAGMARWILIIIALLDLVFLLGMLFGYHPPTELHGVAFHIKLLMGLTVLSAVLTAAALAYLILAWKNRIWGIVSRLYYTLVTVAALAFVWFLNQWNLLGWRY